MYAQDSFFTLTTGGQIGLGLLSLCMSCLMIWGMLAIRARLIWRIVAALLGLWLFMMISPQIYYLYYMTLLDGLPLQWVISRVLPPVHILKLLSFQAEPTLSAHSAGFMGWCMIAAAAIRKKP